LSDRALTDSIVELAAALVRLPSRVGIDSPEPVLDCAAAWFRRQGIEPLPLRDETGVLVGIHVRHTASADGPALCLDACIDTAPFGEESLWRDKPTSGAVRDGALWGRGAADSKMGAAILAHVVRDLIANRALGRGTIHLLLDADEHTGRFGGARAFLKALDRPLTGAVLGYPGNDELIRGSRGFHRVRLHAAGSAAHSGAAGNEGSNAVTKLARLISALEEAPLPVEPAGPFAFGPKVTVTGISGGEGFSVVPDRATCSVDIRLTPGFGEAEAKRWLVEIVAACDRKHPSPRPTSIETIETWPAYLVAADDPLTRAFQTAGSAAFARDVPAVVCGPSNIGNLFAAHAVPTLCGLGVTAANVHGTDEHSEIATIAPAYRGYYEGARRYLART
jgi:succinyl-diaminopimelate desuccinylase